MQFYKVPGASIAVIYNYTLEWAKGCGVLEAGGSTQVYTETLFQAASISKPVAAMGIERLRSALGRPFVPTPQRPAVRTATGGPPV